MKDDFRDFLEGSSKVPASVYRDSLQASMVAMAPGRVLSKFYFLNIVGALYTLVFCPQYGFGPMGGGLGFIEKIMHLDPVSCGLICGSIFFAGGNLFSFLVLNRSERKWVAKHEHAVLIPYVSLVFVAGMFLKQFSLQHVHNDVFSFYVSWIGAGVILSYVFCKATLRVDRFSNLSAI